jgi:hypothetical protein
VEHWPDSTWVIEQPGKRILDRAVNRWNIPSLLEQHVLDRDRHCVYCGVAFVPYGTDRRSKASWEHIVNDVKIITEANIARCCVSCNASKGARALEVWLESKYCKNRGIHALSVAAVVKAHLDTRTSTLL